MEEQGDQFKVVFAGLLLESAGKQGGRGSKEGAATHTHLSSYVGGISNKIKQRRLCIDIAVPPWIYTNLVAG